MPRCSYSARPSLKAASCACPTETATILDVAEELAALKSKVFQLQREAITLKSSIPGSRLHWRSRTDRLSILRNHVNDMGRMLASLEEMKPTATNPQQAAIETAWPQLVAIADQVRTQSNW